MTASNSPAVVWVLSALAGFLGALTGLGGGVVVVPALTLALGVDMKYAIGASLVSVIATSSGAAAAYVREGFSNIRIGMFLEIATTIGAIVGRVSCRPLQHACARHRLRPGSPAGRIQIVQRHKPGARDASRPMRWPRACGSAATIPSTASVRTYGVRNVPAGFAMMFGAGTLSGLLGIGSGAVKVIAMDRVMRIPFKVSTTTSNFMIGVTAAASAGLYLSRGYIDPRVAMPVMLGVLAGALLGAKVLVHARVKTLRAGLWRRDSGSRH